MIVENKKYYVKALNSSKANKMTCLYHYSGVATKQASINLGVYRKEDQKLVGVLQWGCSFNSGIRLDRYVKEEIDRTEYLELNRFSMADSEGKNSESQAISLGIKWIKRNMPEIRLLVSYAGRKEGNYGYIYQATNWEYLGYFVSEGFWYLDGEERHMTTVWARYNKYGNQSLGFIDGVCEMYQDVRKTWTKQFMYIIRLDESLTPASDLLPYPKPSNEFPIKTRELIYKQNDEVFNSYKAKEKEFVEYYDEGEEFLFSRQTLIRRGSLIPFNQRKIAVYNIGGELLETYDNIKHITFGEWKEPSVRESLIQDRSYKGFYFRFYEDEPIEQLDVPFLCYIDEIPFGSLAEVGRYTKTTKQAAFAAKKRQSKCINGYNVEWVF